MVRLRYVDGPTSHRSVSVEPCGANSTEVEERKSPERTTDDKLDLSLQGVFGIFMELGCLFAPFCSQWGVRNVAAYARVEEVSWEIATSLEWWLLTSGHQRYALLQHVVLFSG